MIDPQDPTVAAMAMDVLSRVRGGPVQRARALRDAVAEHIKDTNLGVGLASASEVARTRTGDCTEHAVLLAAMLRAGGFPSRVVSGLVYVDDFAGEKGVFGYHMWTQAIVDEGKGPIWIDLDAAIPSPQVPGEVDATHIALSTSALATGDNMSVAGLALVLGRLSIEVLDVRVVAP
jgi:transglutaminase-like putative cysteine protease